MQTSDRLSGWMKLYINYAVIAILSVAYMALAVLKLEPTGKHLPEIISDTVLSFLLGTCISTLFRNFGLRLGEAEPRVSAAVEAHEREAVEAAPRIDALSAWCMEETRRVLRYERMRVLADESMSLADCFDAEGRPIPYEPRYIKRRLFSAGWLAAVRFNRMETRRLKVAVRAAYLKITPLSAGDLISEGHKPGDPFHMGRSKRNYKVQSRREGMISKVMVAVISGYYGMSLLEDFSPGALMWRVFQVILFVAFGVMQQATAMDYMTDEYRGRMTAKTGYLLQFKATYEAEQIEHAQKEESEHGKCVVEQKEGPVCTVSECLCTADGAECRGE